MPLLRLCSSAATGTPGGSESRPAAGPGVVSALGRLWVCPGNTREQDPALSSPHRPAGATRPSSTSPRTKPPHTEPDVSTQTPQERPTGTVNCSSSEVCPARWSNSHCPSLPPGSTRRCAPGSAPPGAATPPAVTPPPLSPPPASRVAPVCHASFWLASLWMAPLFPVEVQDGFVLKTE